MQSERWSSECEFENAARILTHQTVFWSAGCLQVAVLETSEVKNKEIDAFLVSPLARQQDGRQLRQGTKQLTSMQLSACNLSRV
jgi:hypothetical protein